MARPHGSLPKDGTVSSRVWLLRSLFCREGLRHVPGDFESCLLLGGGDVVACHGASGPEQALEGRPECTAALYNLNTALRMEGRQLEAIDFSWKWILQRLPTSSRAHERWGASAASRLDAASAPAAGADSAGREVSADKASARWQHPGREEGAEASGGNLAKIARWEGPPEGVALFRLPPLLSLSSLSARRACPLSGSTGAKEHRT